jgi:hypothetical protein
MSGYSHAGGAYKSTRVIRTGVSARPILISTDRAAMLVLRCADGELRGFISAVMQLGWCVSLTQTSDGGACSITCFDGATKYKSYARSADELLVCYRDLLAAIRGEE